ncbi:MAG: type II toxin-antitoxin system PemK/MazF family toxin [Geminicoccaceae bacterium]
MTGFDNRAGFAFGDVVMIPYALSDHRDVMQRPGVVVSSRTYNQQRAEIVVMAITVQDRPNASSGEMTIQDVEIAGLDQGAAFKPVLLTVEQKSVRLILGQLNHRDRERLQHLLRLILGT